jgi:hypothetical protein
VSNRRSKVNYREALAGGGVRGAFGWLAVSHLPESLTNTARLCRERRSGQSLSYVYETKAEADTAKVLTMDEARRIAANIARCRNS